MMARTWKRTCLATGVAASVLVLVGGCGKPSTGEVSGKVTFRGEPVNSGTIAFIGDDGRVTSAMIEGGSYHAKVPLGPVRITVNAGAAGMPIVPLDDDQKGHGPASQGAAEETDAHSQALPGRPAVRSFAHGCPGEAVLRRRAATVARISIRRNGMNSVLRSYSRTATPSSRAT